MILQDENGKFVNAKDFKMELALESMNEEINETDLEVGLSEMYMAALTSELEGFGIPQTSLEGFFPGLGKKILEKVKLLICPKLSNSDTQDTIIETILEALAAILPGGKIITWIVKKLIQFILNKTIDKFCPIQ